MKTGTENPAPTSALPSRWGFAVASGILGWVLDAFSFFVLVFVVDALAKGFHVDKSSVVWSITLTLATRPLGALVFVGGISLAIYGWVTSKRSTLSAKRRSEAHG